MTMLAPPIFIVGSVRSGTTMLRLMLDHHPRLGIFGEFEYGFAWASEDGFPEIDEYLAHLEQDRVFLRNRHQTPPQIGTKAMVRALFEELAERTGKPKVGAAIHSNFHHIPEVWPGAKFIHIVRDPRDVARSVMQMGWVGTLWHGAAFWSDAIRKWDQLASVVPAERRFEVRYEDLVADPEQVLTETCEFLGEEFHPEMLRYDEDTTYSAPDARFVEQWRHRLNEEQLEQVEARCRRQMPRYGYRTATPPRRFGIGERLALHYEHRLNRIRFNLDRYGPQLYLAWQVAKRTSGAPFSGDILRRVRQVDESLIK